MGKVTLEMDVSNEQLEELLGSYKAIEKLTYVTDDMCENFSYLSKAITAIGKHGFGIILNRTDNKRLV